MKKIHEYIATVCGLGYSPVAPGTVGSLAAIPVCLLAHRFTPLYILLFVVFFTAGVVSAGKKEAELGQKDPSCVIIDEFACMFLVFMFVPIKPLYLIVGFIIYRVIDIIKIPPMRTLEQIEGGWGIMLDDAVSGIYTNIILQVLTRLI